MKQLSWLKAALGWLLAVANGIDFRLTISSVIELAGAAAIVYGCFLIVPWLAFIVGGVALLAIGRGIDPPVRAVGDSE